MDCLVHGSVPGTIFYINIRFNPSTQWVRKRIIYIDVDEDGDPLFLKICSDKPFRDYHMIRKDTYPTVLRYDSFVDCGQVYEKLLNENEFIDKVGEYCDTIYECLKEDDKTQIVRRIVASNSISPILKNQIRQSFSS
jgi:hypothetical protein